MREKETGRRAFAALRLSERRKRQSRLRQYEATQVVFQSPRKDDGERSQEPRDTSASFKLCAREKKSTEISQIGISLDAELRQRQRRDCDTPLGLACQSRLSQHAKLPALDDGGQVRRHSPTAVLSSHVCTFLTLEEYLEVTLSSRFHNGHVLLKTPALQRA